MRELTKSSLSTGLAMSLLGMQAMMNVFRRPGRDGRDPTVEALDAVTQAIVDRSGSALRETFQAGDKVQRELVDLTFRFLTLAPMRPAGGTSSLSGATRQATEGVRRWLGDMNLAAGSCGRCGTSDGAWPGSPTSPPPPQGAATPEGWGPVPGKP